MNSLNLKIKPNIILHTVVSKVVYIIFIFSFYLFVVGHNAPGGGFIAGLMTASGIILLYISFDLKSVNDIIRLNFRYVIAVGLSISFLCSCGSMFFGYPFLTHIFGAVDIPFIGHVEMATATIFDFGVYCTVLGGVMTIIRTIAESSSHKEEREEPALWKH